MFHSFHRVREAQRPEAGWPCQRLRMAYALMLFFVFEVGVGQKLPPLMTFLMLMVGMTCFVSARQAIREWKLAYQLVRIQDAIDRMPTRRR